MMMMMMMMMMVMFVCRNAEMSKELDGSRQTMIKKQTEIDQLQNEVAATDNLSS